jgi:hypothetical protein
MRVLIKYYNLRHKLYTHNTHYFIGNKIGYSRRQYDVLLNKQKLPYRKFCLLKDSDLNVVSTASTIYNIRNLALYSNYTSLVPVTACVGMRGRRTNATRSLQLNMHGSSSHAVILINNRESFLSLKIANAFLLTYF